MNSDNAARIWDAIALRAQQDHTSISPQYACHECRDALAVTGVGLMLSTNSALLEPAYCSGSEAESACHLQASLGEGPAVDALKGGRTVLADDLDSHAWLDKWPVFTGEATRLGVRAVHSFPLALGAVRVGSLSLYSDSARELTGDQLVDALIYADTALLLAIDARSGIATPADGGVSDGQGPALWQAELHQAAGMVSTMLDTSPLDALVHLRGYAFNHELSLSQAARAVVERRLQFQPDTPDKVAGHSLNATNVWPNGLSGGEPQSPGLGRPGLPPH